MSGPIQRLFDQIFSASNNLNSTPNRSSEPYYKYGQKYFNTFEANPPQIRLKPTSGIITRKEKNPTSTVSASLGTLEQDVEISIWGNTEDEVFQELAYLVDGIEYIRGTRNNESISQPSIFETSTQWVDTSAFNSYGEMLLLNYKVKLNIKNPVSVDFALATSASIQISGSSYSNSGSYQGTRAYMFLSNSYNV